MPGFSSHGWLSFHRQRLYLVKPAFLAHPRQKGKTRFYDFGTGGRTALFALSVALANAKPGGYGIATGTRSLRRST